MYNDIFKWMKTFEINLEKWGKSMNVKKNCWLNYNRSNKIDNERKLIKNRGKVKNY